MLPWIIQMSIISFILIILIHYLYNFFKNNLTIPKVKDLVNKPQQQYETIFNSINQDNTISNQNHILPINNKNINNNNNNNNNNNIIVPSNKNNSLDNSLDNRLDNSLDNRLDNTLDNSLDNTLDNSLDNTLDNNTMKHELKNYLKELSKSKQNDTKSIQSIKQSTNTKPFNINDNNGILTGENAMISSFSTNNYSSF